MPAFRVSARVTLERVGAEHGSELGAPGCEPSSVHYGAVLSLRDDTQRQAPAHSAQRASERANRRGYGVERDGVNDALPDAPERGLDDVPGDCLVRLIERSLERAR